MNKLHQLNSEGQDTIFVRIFGTLVKLVMIDKIIIRTKDLQKFIQSNLFQKDHNS